MARVWLVRQTKEYWTDSGICTYKGILEISLWTYEHFYNLVPRLGNVTLLHISMINECCEKDV